MSPTKSKAPDGDPADKTTETVGHESPGNSFWSTQTAHFEETRKYGPEVNSNIAEAGKVFWQREISNEEEAKVLLERNKIPSNCKFLEVLKVNKEIWSETSADIRTKDVALQKGMETLGRGAASILRAANLIQDLVANVQDDTGQYKKAMDPVVEAVKDGLVLLGKVRLQLNSHRRECFKGSLPQHLKNMATKPEIEFEEYLFGDDINKRLTDIRGDNAVRAEFKKKQAVSGSSKGRYSTSSSSNPNKENRKDDSGNARPFQKSRGGDYGSQKKKQYKKSSYNKNNNKDSKKKTKRRARSKSK